MTLDFLTPVIPQILLLVLSLLVLALDIILPKEQQRNLGWVTAAGLVIIMLILIPFMPGDMAIVAWGGMVRYDWMSYVFTMLFMFGAAITALMAMDFNELGARGEFYVLMLASTIGMVFMASATDLVMLYLAIETVSIPMYILAGFFVKTNESTEAGFKYLLFGAMTSAVMLYGFSLLYGFSGQTSLYLIALGMSEGMIPVWAMVGALLLVLVGLAFKISAVPFHFWAPDVYQGAPTPVAGFLSTASKAAGFAVLIRVLYLVFPLVANNWIMILAAISVATMTLGNLIALTQRNIKRMLAYSSIAHAGYVLIGVVALAPSTSTTANLNLGMTSVVYYLVAYLLTNLAAFGVVAIYGRVAGSDDMTAYYGMSRRSPWLAMAMLVAFLSLAGMPPFAGFIAKALLFAAAIESKLYLLAVVGVMNSIVGLYYYLTVLKYVYLYRAENDDQPVPMTRAYSLALGVLVLGIILVGTLFGPWFSWAGAAAASMF
ncbi:MAG: NADH-quinone oxidoreductase subunit N [Chloroflexota bacterium]